MAEYITKEQALETQCEKCPMYNCILRCSSYNAVKNLSPANVVERSKIDRAIEEIQKLRGCSCSCSDGIIDDVEDILDKLIESEG